MSGQVGILIVTLLAIVVLFFSFPALTHIARLKHRQKARQMPLRSGAELLFDDGRTAFGKKRYRDAARMLDHAARIRPERALTHYYLGLSLAALGNFAKAEQAYKEALRRDPKSNIAWSELGDLYRKLNRWEDAIEAYRHALQIKPDLATAHYGLEAAYAYLDNKEAA